MLIPYCEPPGASQGRALLTRALLGAGAVEPAQQLGVVVSQGFGAPSLAVLGPKGVVVLVVAGPLRSQGFGGAGLPVMAST